jgi:predicted enzyme related to lactoylglutathione lyase
MKYMLCIGAIFVLGLAACTDRSGSTPPAAAGNTTESKTTLDMKNRISIVEIPAADFQRAMSFYQVILDVKLEEAEMEGIKLGLFPPSGDGAFVQLIHGTDYKPSPDGVVVYLNAGSDLQEVAGKIESNGGTMVVPKTSMGPEMGFFAIFIDSEGNKLGLYSSN